MTENNDNVGFNIWLVSIPEDEQRHLLIETLVSFTHFSSVSFPLSLFFYFQFICVFLLKLTIEDPTNTSQLSSLTSLPWPFKSMLPNLSRMWSTRTHAHVNLYSYVDKRFRSAEAVTRRDPSVKGLTKGQ